MACYWGDKYNSQWSWLKLKLKVHGSTNTKKRYQTNCWINRSTKFQNILIDYLLYYSTISTLLLAVDCWITNNQRTELPRYVLCLILSCTRGLLLFVLLLLHLAKYSPQYVCRSRPAPAPAPSLCPRCLLLSGPPAPAPVTASSSHQPLTSESWHQWICPITL